VDCAGRGFDRRLPAPVDLERVADPLRRLAGLLCEQNMAQCKRQH
jgi:hypothetical protein